MVKVWEFESLNFTDLIEYMINRKRPIFDYLVKTCS